MAVTSYKENGSDYWAVYVNIRSSKNRTIRKQKRIHGLESEKKAIQLEKSLIKSLTEEINALENLGATWIKVVDQWEIRIRNDPFQKYAKTTINDYLATIRTWTKKWNERYASTLNSGDGRALINFLREEGKSYNYIRRLKNTINLIYRWGIEERLILGVSKPPLEGVKLEKFEPEKVPEILTREQIKKLLYEAKRKEHPWYSVWAFAVLTGMRNGELHALKWTKVDFDLGILRIDCTYNSRSRSVKQTTKAGYWRTVPISKDLKELLVELKSQTGDKEFVLPRFWQWDRGSQAGVLRSFCKEIGIPSVRFHTLRACFATQLLASGVPIHKVMAICGWRETKTMDVYVRLTGVNVAGATDSLDVIPKAEIPTQNVVNLFRT